MASRDVGDLIYACLTHVPLQISYPQYVRPIYLGAAQQGAQLNLRELAPEWNQHHPTLGSTAGAFALSRLLRSHYPHAARVGICQYRKFVSRTRLGGIPARSYPVMDVVAKASLTPQALERALDPGDANLLVSRPMTFGSTESPIDVLAQYQSAHHVEDLLRFAAEAVSVGALDRTEVTAFFGDTFLVPGGIELGVFPAAFWIRSIGLVEATIRSCVDNLTSGREGYQMRVWSFCAERLGSYLLLKEFRPAQVPRRRLLPFGRSRGSILPEHCIGQLNLIDDKEGADYVVGSSGA